MAIVELRTLPTDSGCGRGPQTTARSGPPREVQPFVTGSLSTPVGPVPRVRTDLVAADRLGAARVRLGGSRKKTNMSQTPRAPLPEAHDRACLPVLRRAGAGDVDGDGYGDVLIGSSRGEGDGRPSGRALLLEGPLRGAVGPEDAAAILLGPDCPDTNTGAGVAGGGDTDGDGLADVLVGTLRWCTGDGAERDPGRVHVFRGPLAGDHPLSDADAVLIGETGYDDCGQSLAPAGDVNGDGIADIVVGAPRNSASAHGAAGAAHVAFGPFSGTLQLSDIGTALYGESEYADAGVRVGAAGDLDSDGLDDVLVGAYTDSTMGERAGRAYVVRGPVEESRYLSEANVVIVAEGPYTFLGTGVASAGDFDGDSARDVLVGAPGDMFHGAPTLPGTAFLFLNPQDGTITAADADLVLWVRRHSTSWAGRSRADRT